MADEFDIDDLLEAPYQKPNNTWGSDDETETKVEKSDEKEKEKDKDRDKDKKKKKSSRRSRSRSKDRSSRKKRSRSRSRDRSRRRSRERRRSRSRSRDRNPDRNFKCYECNELGHKAANCPKGRGRRRSRSRSRSGPREVIRRSRDGVTTISLLTDRELEDDQISQEERDARTVFIMQLSRNVTVRDIQEFFNQVGTVRDVRLISDRNSKRSKGIGYVEFTEAKAVPAAIKISGQRLLGVPIMVSPTMAEKNRLAAAQAAMVKPQGPIKLYIGSLHQSITDAMLRAIFEPFGVIESVSLAYEEGGASKGYGYVVFKDSSAGRRALEQMNGFDLAGRAMKVTEVGDGSRDGGGFLDTEETEKGGIEMNSHSRAELMRKLAATHGANPSSVPAPTPGLVNPLAPNASPCLILKNLFDPREEKDPTWAQDYRNDVLEELKKFGIVVHINVDTISPEGNIYIKSLTADTAAKIIQSFNGRWFAGRTIAAMTVPQLNYHTMFPDSMSAVRPLKAEDR